MIEEVFKTNERFLWGLCYRLTGNAADADDIVRETFLRAMKTPPARTNEPWRPWLVRVAMNLGRDLLRKRRRQQMERFLACLANHDVAGAEAMLAADARHLSDGGGEFIAARVPIAGARKIVTFNANLMKWAAGARVEWRMLNGLPAIWWESDRAGKGYPPRGVTVCTLGVDGLIQSIHTVVATRKLRLTNHS